MKTFKIKKVVSHTYTKTNDLRDAIMTSFKTDFFSSYNKVKSILGDAYCSTDMDKVNVIWIFKGDDGSSITIYDYKDSNPLDDKDKNRSWHVGGRNIDIKDIFLWLSSYNNFK